MAGLDPTALRSSFSCSVLAPLHRIRPQNYPVAGLDPAIHVWTAPWMQGRVCSFLATVRLRSCVRPFAAARWPLAQMGSADEAQTRSAASDAPVDGTGSLVRRVDRSPSSALRSFTLGGERSGGDRRVPVAPPAR